MKMSKQSKSVLSSHVEVRNRSRSRCVDLLGHSDV